MSSFANSFWSADYAGGLGVLFGKLQQGVQENEQLLTVARARAEAEDTFGQKLADIETATNRIDGGFQRDDGASVKKAYEGVRTEMGEEARNHKKIASNIRELVVNPFSRWCDQHAARVQNSQDDLQGRIKAHDRQAETVRQYRSQYYNKCRRVEDLDEEEKLAFQDPQAAAVTNSPKAISVTSVPSIKIAEEEPEPEPVEIGDETYQPEQIKRILSHALDNIPLGETKVPILGTYQNTTSGADITEYIQKHLGANSVAYAERIGQDLCDNGFLRLVGNVGNSFANSSKMKYQWKTKVFQITGMPEKRNPLHRSSTMMSSSSDGSTPGSPVIGDKVSEYLGGWNPLNNAHPNETPAERLRREAREADERYKTAVKKLDGLRCSLEEAMIDHMKFMERCELDRLKAIKSVILDFSGAVSNVIPSLQSSVDNMMLFQETVQPLGDLRYLLENYRTGSYVPKVTVYENYYNKVEDQTFAVDIEARARADKKRVPLIITSILTFLDSHYPDLEGDEARRSIWLVDVPLGATHHLRNQINNGGPVSQATLEKYEVPIVAALLKLYLLELPDSLVSSHVYEIIKTIYASTAQSTSEAARVQVIQSTLGQLRLANIATLDALITHFTRLIELTSADDEYVGKLATVLAPCIMRPKQETGLSMNEKYNVRLIRDLLAHKDAIFGELKRQSSLTHTASGTRQTRAISTDESKRKEAMEERQRAIAAAQHTQTTGVRSRASSPATDTRVPLPVAGHRRDRSRGPETRFPVSTTAAQNSRVMSPTADRSSTSTTSGHRDSLSVPQSPPSSRTGDAPEKTNGFHQPPPAEGYTPRARSGTETTNRSSAHVSASINSPSDFINPSQFYTGGADNQPPAASTTTRDSVASNISIKAPASKYKLSNPEEQSPVAATPTDGTPTKTDSFSRSRGVAGRRGTGGLRRQSLVNKHESGDLTDSPVAAESPETRGVQLEDKAMDFD
ncbi:putative Rho GTPase activation protein [Septoria linicola]|nr:putative Rho GTPase activation protein [Septoria linicola]